MVMKGSFFEARRIRQVGPIDWRGRYAALGITLLVMLGIEQVETQRIAALDRYRVQDLGGPMFGHLYSPWASWAWMDRFDGPLTLAQVQHPRALDFVRPGEASWARRAFADERARLPFELVGSIVLFTVLLCVLQNRTRTRYSHGHSRWATRRDIRRSSLTKAENGIVLGEYPTSNDLLIYQGEGNILVLGPPGSGKTQGVMVPTLLRTWPESAIVFDPSGELAEKTSWARKKTVIFDPRDPKTATFNPLQGVAPEHVDEITTVLSSYFLEKDPSEMSEASSYFIFSALELGVALTARALERAREQNDGSSSPGFADVAAYYYAGNFENDTEFIKSFKVSSIPYVRDTAAKYEKMHEEQRSSVIGTLTRYLALFRSADVAHATSCSSFTAQELRESSTTLYLTVRERDAAALNPLMRMILTRLFDDLTVKIPEKNEQSIAVLLDEFPLLKAPIIQQKLATFRKYRIHPVLLAQTLTQIVEYYGVNEVISGLCDVRVYFPSMDVRTQQNASAACGSMTQWVESISHNGNTSDGNRRSTSLQEVGRALLLEHELGSLGNDAIIVAKKGDFPIKAAPVRPYLDARFGGIYGR